MTMTDRDPSRHWWQLCPLCGGGGATECALCLGAGVLDETDAAQDIGPSEHIPPGPRCRYCRGLVSVRWRDRMTYCRACNRLDRLNPGEGEPDPPPTAA
jgi:hypothetical protein